MTSPGTNDFGITPALISARVQGLTIGPGSVPSTAAVEAMIDESADLVCGEAENIGITVAGMTEANNPAVFRRLRGMVVNHVIYRCLIARDRGADLAESYLRLYTATLDTMRASASRVSGPTDGPSQVRSPIIEPDASASSAARLGTLPGKVVSGGL
jgi:hypothetical protein